MFGRHPAPQPVTPPTVTIPWLVVLLYAAWLGTLVLAKLGRIMPQPAKLDNIWICWPLALCSFFVAKYDIDREASPAIVPQWQINGLYEALIFTMPVAGFGLLLISEAGSEGLDLKGVRDVILLEPHFHEAVAHQVIGRAVRYESHAKLPPNERNVTVHRVLLSKPTTTGRRWEEIEARNDTKLRQLVDTYAHLVHAEGPAQTSVELTLNTAARDAGGSAMSIWLLFIASEHHCRPHGSCRA